MEDYPHLLDWCDSQWPGEVGHLCHSRFWADGFLDVVEQAKDTNIQTELHTKLLALSIPTDVVTMMDGITTHKGQGLQCINIGAMGRHGSFRLSFPTTHVVTCTMRVARSHCYRNNI